VNNGRKVSVRDERMELQEEGRERNDRDEAVWNDRQT
jgi:hypothetical protein